MAAKAAKRGPAVRVRVQGPTPVSLKLPLLTIELDRDGFIKRNDVEELAFTMADDFSGPEAWILCGRQNSGMPGHQRRFAEKHPVFQARMAVLLEEKRVMELDPVWGQAAWQARQLWRLARIKGDLKVMSEATQLSFKVATQMHGMAAPAKSAAETGDDAEGDEFETGPGRPASKNPQSSRDPQQLRGLLAHMGSAKPREAEMMADEDVDAVE